MKGQADSDETSYEDGDTDEEYDYKTTEDYDFTADITTEVTTTEWYIWYILGLQLMLMKFYKKFRF